MTARPSGPPPIVYILLFAILGGGGWYAYRSGLLDSLLNRSTPTQAGIPVAQPQAPTAPNPPQAQAPNPPANAVNLDTSLPNPAVLPN